MDRTDVPTSWDERAILRTFLRYARQSAVAKASGLSDEQARIAPIPTSPVMTVAGVINHLRWVERSWFEADLLGGEEAGPWTEGLDDRDFSIATELPLAEVVGAYERQCRHYEALVEELPLDMLAARPLAGGEVPTLRWILWHLVEETSRHNGHLDILRELVDGTRGD